MNRNVQGGSVERTVRLPAMPARVTCGCAHGIILVKTADLPSKLLAVTPEATGKGYAVLGRGEDVLPVNFPNSSPPPAGEPFIPCYRRPTGAIKCGKCKNIILAMDAFEAHNLMPARSAIL